MNIIYDTFDGVCAENLNISINDWVIGIESILEKYPYRGDVILNNLIDYDLSKERKERISKIFNKLL